MKRILSLALVLAMLCLLAACAPTDAQKLVGTWKASLDLTEALNQEIVGNDETMAPYLKIHDFTLEMVLTFYEDGTYSMGVSADSVASALEGVKADISDGLYAYCENVIAESDLEMTVEELLELSGLDMDALMEEAFPASMEEEFVAELASEGNYEAKEGKLYLSDGKEYNVDEAVYEVYTLEGSTLTLVESVGSDMNEMYLSMYPMVFQKVG